MNETDACRALLVRAFEAPVQAPWTDADRDWATREVARLEGATAPAERVIARRAALVLQRLAPREPRVNASLALARPSGWGGVAMLVAAALAGVSLDTVGRSGHIELLAPPLIGLMLWNAVVYLLLAWHAVVRHDPDTPMRRGLVRLRTRLASSRLGPSPPALARFVADWAEASSGLQAARATALLHAGAATFAAGALASLYLHGLVFEYRAGWQSTFLDATAVHRVLANVFAPASALSGLAIPGVEAIERLRLPANPGENAARWIHLNAITVTAFVVLPRIALALAAGWHARALGAELPVPLNAAYFQRLLPRDGSPALEVPVHAFNYRFAEELRAGLAAALSRHLGREITPVLGEALVEGDDAALARLPAAAWVAALLPATATPELETHGAFLRAWVRRAGPAGRVLAVVDESVFRRRFDGAEGVERLKQRREAWQALLDEVGAEAVFADLSNAESVIA